MTTATNTLRDEHKAILKMLDATEEVARKIKGGAAVKQETLSGLLEFLRIFADRCHHGKEEECLFPALEERGLPSDGGPIGVMLHEHDQGRELIQRMLQAVQGCDTGDSGAPLRWAEAALEYSALLRAHIAKENDVLFVMADRLLSDSRQAILLEAFEKIETEKMGPGTHERLHKLMDKLYADIFGKH